MNGRELRKWRRVQYLSQAALADILDLNVNTIANWENDRTRIPSSAALALEGLEEKRERIVARLRRQKEEIEHRRNLKMIKQHPAHYAKLLENVRKARAAKAARDALYNRAKKANAS